MESLPPMDDPFVPQSDWQPPTVAERPGCITAYVILIGLIFAGALFVGILLPLGVIGSSNVAASRPQMIPTLIISFVAAIFIGLLIFLYLRGLWRMRNWARIVAILLHTVSLCSTITQITGRPSARFGSTAYASGNVVGTIIGLLIALYVIFWFATNRKKFV